MGVRRNDFRRGAESRIIAQPKGRKPVKGLQFAAEW